MGHGAAGAGELSLCGGFQLVQSWITNRPQNPEAPRTPGRLKRDGFSAKEIFELHVRGTD